MTKFKDGFMMKSPLPKHGKEFRDKAMRLSKESSGRSDAPDYDNPEVVKLLEDAKKAEAEHDSPAKMSPFHGYADGEERASHYKSTVDLYTNLFDTMAENVNEISKDARKKKVSKDYKNLPDDQFIVKYGMTKEEYVDSIKNK